VNAFFWLICGALVGIGASWRTRIAGHVLRNVTIGAIGGAAGGWLVAPYLGHGVADESELSILGLVVASASALLLLVAAALYRDGMLR
jgi:uncharacterized membrane protein YeaQ/YmgE (transglycosylase-associated protein family)